MKFTGVLTLLCTFLLGLSVYAQEEGEQQVTLDKETLDAIAARASPVCRSELEAALAQQTEISMDCKQEIHKILLSLSDKYASATPDAGIDGAPPVPSGNPGLWIGVFVTLALIAVGSYVHYVNSAMAEVGGEKVKKPLSKKKVTVFICYYPVPYLPNESCDSLCRWRN